MPIYHPKYPIVSRNESDKNFLLLHLSVAAILDTRVEVYRKHPHYVQSRKLRSRRVLSVRAVSAAVAAFTLRLSRARDNRSRCNLRNHPLHRHLARRTSKRGETETAEKARDITPLSSINGLTPNERRMQRNI